MCQAPSRDTVSAVRLETIGMTDRTDPMLGPDPTPLDPIAGQNPSRQSRQVELKMIRPAGDENPFQNTGVALRKRYADGIVHFVAATTSSRTHGSNQIGTLRRCRHRSHAGLYHPHCQTSPTCVDCCNRTSVLGSEQDRDAIRSHDSDRGSWCQADDDIGLGSISFDLRGRIEHLDPMNLDRKHCCFRGLGTTLTKPVFDAKIYENAIA
jgi:hypothetical protein